MELWNAYDKTFNKIANSSLVRGEEIPKGLFHLVCTIVVQHSDGSYLLTQRDKNKKFGGMWELSAGGSALKDEKPIDCARRELKEETGIITGEMTEILRTSSDETQSIYVVYLCKTDCLKNSVKLQAGETVSYKWLSKDAILEMNEEILLFAPYRNRVKEFIQGLN